jgi:hypothetical protein
MRWNGWALTIACSQHALAPVTVGAKEKKEAMEERKNKSNGATRDGQGRVIRWLCSAPQRTAPHMMDVKWKPGAQWVSECVIITVGGMIATRVGEVTSDYGSEPSDPGIRLRRLTVSSNRTAYRTFSFLLACPQTQCTLDDCRVGWHDGVCPRRLTKANREWFPLTVTACTPSVGTRFLYLP